MIRYTVWFSDGETADQAEEVSRLGLFLDDLQSRNLIHRWELATARETDVERQVVIEFMDEEQFKAPFREVLESGVHEGKHGAMIGKIKNFRVQTERL